MATHTHGDGRIESGDHVMIPLNGTQGDARLYSIQGPGVRWETTVLIEPEKARNIIELIEDAFTMGFEGAQRQMRVALGLESYE